MKQRALTTAILTLCALAAALSSADVPFTALDNVEGDQIDLLFMPVDPMVVSGDGTTLWAVNTHGSTVVGFDLATGSVLRTLDAPWGPVSIEYWVSPQDGHAELLVASRVLVAAGNKTEMANALHDACPLAADDARLKWLRGHCGGAEREQLWREAHDGFAKQADDLWTARATLDLAGHYLGEERRDDALALAAELARAFGALAEDSESLAALKALRSAVASGTLTSGVLGEVGSVLGRWEWERRGRSAWGLAE